MKRFNQNSYHSFKTQYLDIGRTLLACEASSLKVGIPLLPPTRRVSRLRLLVNCPLDEFLRLSLLSISTSALESYCEDLLSSPKNTAELDLAITIPSFYERHFFSTTVAFVGIVLFITLLMQTNLSPLFGYPLALAIGAMCGSVSATLATERYRRATFYKLIEKEIMRRHGLDMPGTKTVRIPSTQLGS